MSSLVSSLRLPELRSLRPLPAAVCTKLLTRMPPQLRRPNSARLSKSAIRPPASATWIEYGYIAGNLWRAAPNATITDLVSETELTGIIQEAEAMTETYMKSMIEQGARSAYRRLVDDAPEVPATKQ
jgi:hypothetical protein